VGYGSISVINRETATTHVNGYRGAKYGDQGTKPTDSIAL